MRMSTVLRVLGLRGGAPPVTMPEVPRSTAGFFLLEIVVKVMAAVALVLLAVVYVWGLL